MVVNVARARRVGGGTPHWPKRKHRTLVRGVGAGCRREVPAPGSDREFRTALARFRRASAETDLTNDQRAEMARDAVTLGDGLAGVLTDEQRTSLGGPGLRDGPPPLLVIQSAPSVVPT